MIFMERDFNNNFVPPYMDCMPPNNQNDVNDIYKDPFLNPMMQYEQACSYYRYLCLQMDYKMKCKEYEKMCKNENSNTNPRERN